MTDNQPSGDGHTNQPVAGNTSSREAERALVRQARKGLTREFGTFTQALIASMSGPAEPSEQATPPPAAPIIERDGSGHVVRVRYPDMSERAFEYDAQHAVVTVRDRDGSSWKLRDGIWVQFAADGGASGAIWEGSIEVDESGVYSYSDKTDLSTVREHPDGRKVVEEPSGLTVEADSQKRVTRIGYPDGSQRRLVWTEAGSLASVCEPDGSEWRAGGSKTWRKYDSAGKDTGVERAGDISVDELGNYVFADCTTGNRITCDAYGNRTTESPDGSQLVEYADGTIFIEKVDGSKMYTTADGTHITETGRGLVAMSPSGAIIEAGIDRRITSISYPDHRLRQFGYSETGDLKLFVDWDMTVWRLSADVWRQTTAAGEPTFVEGNFTASVDAAGNFSRRQAQPKFELTVRTDGGMSLALPDGSIIEGAQAEALFQSQCLRVVRPDEADTGQPAAAEPVDMAQAPPKPLDEARDEAKERRRALRQEASMHLSPWMSEIISARAAEEAAAPLWDTGGRQAAASLSPWASLPPVTDSGQQAGAEPPPAEPPPAADVHPSDSQAGPALAAAEGPGTVTPWARKKSPVRRRAFLPPAPVAGDRADAPAAGAPSPGRFHMGVELDEGGLVRRIYCADGTHKELDYGEDGQVTLIKLSDGTVSRKDDDGLWQTFAADGRRHGGKRKARVTADCAGNLIWEYLKDGSTTIYRMDGSTFRIDGNGSPLYFLSSDGRHLSITASGQIEYEIKEGDAARSVARDFLTCANWDRAGLDWTESEIERAGQALASQNGLARLEEAAPGSTLVVSGQALQQAGARHPAALSQARARSSAAAGQGHDTASSALAKIDRDALDRIERLVYADGRTRVFTYGDDGRIATVKDLDGTIFAAGRKNTWKMARGGAAETGLVLGSKFSVGADGTFTCEDPINGILVAHLPSGAVSIGQPDGKTSLIYADSSRLEKDSRGKTIRYISACGRHLRTAAGSLLIYEIQAGDTLEAVAADALAYLHRDEPGYKPGEGEISAQCQRILSKNDLGGEAEIRPGDTLIIPPADG